MPLGETKPLGTGDAVASAESFVGGSDFVVAYGDSIISSPDPPGLVQRMIRSHERHGSACTIGAWEVTPEMVSNYGILVPGGGSRPARSDCRLADIIEKPDARRDRRAASR